MATFEELVASRKDWIEDVLKPWCREADLNDLKKAASEWGDIAGRVDPEATLWSWAWSRFPDLVDEEFAGVNETYEVRVTLKDGHEVLGFPNARSSKQGQLVLLCTARSASPGAEERGPYSIDEIASVAKV